LVGASQGRRRTRLGCDENRIRRHALAPGILAP
jgi:hypothetical protein